MDEKTIKKTEGELAFPKEKGWKKAKLTTRGFVLAEGEHTGNAHVIEPQAAEMGVEMFVNDRGVLGVYIPESISGAVTIKHEEHDPIQIETKGAHTVGIVQEVDHFKQETRRVYD